MLRQTFEPLFCPQLLCHSACAQHRLPPPPHAHHVEPLAREDDLPHRLPAVAAGALQPIAHFHSADFAFGIPDHQQHRERLRHPVTGVALVLDREDLRAVALALALGGIVGLELQPERQRRSVHQPRVGAKRLPWVPATNVHNPEGVE